MIGKGSQGRRNRTNERKIRERDTEIAFICKRRERKRERERERERERGNKKLRVNFSMDGKTREREIIRKEGEEIMKRWKGEKEKERKKRRRDRERKIEK